MKYIELDGAIKILQSLKADENTALYIMDRFVQLYNEAIDDCINSLQKCDIIEIIENSEVNKNGKDL